MTKKIGIAAATAVIVGAMALGSAANAQGYSLGGGSWYAKGFGGATFPESDSTSIEGTALPSDPEFKLKFDTGYTLGAAIGYAFTPNIATELEYAYRRANLNQENEGGDLSSNAFMLNAVYKLDGMGANGAWQPYFGGGLGVANVDVATDNFGDFTQDSALAYQLIGGVAYNFSPAWSLLGEVRWFGTEGGTYDGSNGRSFDATFSTIDLLVGAAYNF
jgi:opacity protein-like surface antigen